MRKSKMPAKPEFVAGMKAYVEAHPDLDIGEPIMNELYVVPGRYCIQATTNGKLEYFAEAAEQGFEAIHFTPQEDIF